MGDSWTGKRKRERMACAFRRRVSSPLLARLRRAKGGEKRGGDPGDLPGSGLSSSSSCSRSPLRPMACCCAPPPPPGEGEAPVEVAGEEAPLLVLLVLLVVVAVVADVVDEDEEEEAEGVSGGKTKGTKMSGAGWVCGELKAVALDDEDSSRSRALLHRCSSRVITSSRLNNVEKKYCNTHDTHKTHTTRARHIKHTTHAQW